MTITTLTKAWCNIRSCVRIVGVASVLGRFRHACHYGSLVIRDVTERFVLIIKS